MKFIEEFKNKVNWEDISAYQKLSERFIRRFKNKLNFENISIYQKLSPEFRKELKLKTFKDSWMCWSKNKKKKFIQTNFQQYEIIGNKLYAYKSVRSDGYSIYNFQYHYEVGKEYEAHANCNSDEDNSFGLSAWTKSKALNYHSNGKLFKVEIDLEDLACITYEGKIRASKIKILEEINKED